MYYFHSPNSRFISNIINLFKFNLIFQNLLFLFSNFPSIILSLNLILYPFIPLNFLPKNFTLKPYLLYFNFSHFLFVLKNLTITKIMLKTKISFLISIFSAKAINPFKKRKEKRKVYFS
jgi:hypothetical protein